MDITDLSSLSFFTVSRHEYQNEITFDFSSCPRPHFCMGLIIKGSAVFSSKTDCSEDICVYPGDIIFVPVTSRYVSVWSGDPDIFYISMHFVFKNSAFFTHNQKLKIQKITLDGFDKLKSDFTFAYDNYNADTSQQLGVLAVLYDVLSRIEPHLKRTKNIKMDKRIEKAVTYINLNSEKEISIPDLAHMSNMSTSHFYSCFKAAVNMTPVEYKNLICINRAMLLLISDYDKSIEEISETLGFYSSTYFRRIFKKITGKTPSEYRKSAVEL